MRMVIVVHPMRKLRIHGFDTVWTADDNVSLIGSAGGS
jgi:hypothetical protein